MDIKVIQQNQPVHADCAEIAFINLGTTTVTLNNVFPIVAGASIAFNGNENEIDTTMYQVSFTGGAGQLYIFRKLFNDQCQ
jgi:hypothetical protein